MLTLIEILLGIAALYSGGMYALHFIQWARFGFGPVAYETHQETYHLGLCFILSIGFLGIILGGC